MKMIHLIHSNVLRSNVSYSWRDSFSVCSPYEIPLQYNVQPMTSNRIGVKLVVDEYQQTEFIICEKSQCTDAQSRVLD